MDALADKLSHALPAIRQRALRSLHSKLDLGLLSLNDLSRHNKIIHALLRWFQHSNDAHDDLERTIEQHEQVLDLLHKVASEGSSATMRLLSLEAVPLLNEFQAALPTSDNSASRSPLLGKVDALRAQLLSAAPYLEQLQSSLHTRHSPAPGLSTTDTAPDASLASLATSRAQSSNVVSSSLPAATSTTAVSEVVGSRNPLIHSSISAYYTEVVLSRGDEQWLMELSLDLNVEHAPTVAAACHTLLDKTLGDFPPEVFLQRTRIFRALVQLLASAASPGNESERIDHLAALCLRSLFARLQSHRWARRLDGDQGDDQDHARDSPTSRRVSEFNYPPPLPTSSARYRTGLTPAQAGYAVIAASVALLRDASRAAVLAPLIHAAMELVPAEALSAILLRRSDAPRLHVGVLLQAQNDVDDASGRLPRESRPLLVMVGDVLDAHRDDYFASDRSGRALLVVVCDMLLKSIDGVRRAHSLLGGEDVRDAASALFPSARRGFFETFCSPASISLESIPTSLRERLARLAVFEPLAQLAATVPVHASDDKETRSVQELLLEVLSHFDEAYVNAFTQSRCVLDSVRRAEVLVERSMQLSADDELDSGEWGALVNEAADGLTFVAGAAEAAACVLVAGMHQVPEQQQWQNTFVCVLSHVDAGVRKASLEFLLRAVVGDVQSAAPRLIEALISESMVDALMANAAMPSGEDESESEPQLALSVLVELCDAQTDRVVPLLRPHFLLLTVLAVRHAEADGLCAALIESVREAGDPSELQLDLCGRVLLLFHADTTARASAARDLALISAELLFEESNTVARMRFSARASLLADEPARLLLPVEALAGRHDRVASSDSAFSARDVRQLLDAFLPTSNDENDDDVDIRATAGEQLVSVVSADPRFRPLVDSPLVREGVTLQLGYIMQRVATVGGWKVRDRPMLVASLRLLSVLLEGDEAPAGHDVVSLCLPLLFHDDAQVRTLAAHTLLKLVVFQSPQREMLEPLLLRHLGDTMLPDDLFGATPQSTMRFTFGAVRAHVRAIAARSLASMEVEPGDGREQTFVETMSTLFANLTASTSHSVFHDRLLEMLCVWEAQCPGKPHGRDGGVPDSLDLAADLGDVRHWQRVVELELQASWAPFVQRFLRVMPRNRDDDRLFTAALDLFSHVLLVANNESGGDAPCALHELLLDAVLRQFSPRLLTRAAQEAAAWAGCLPSGDEEASEDETVSATNSALYDSSRVLLKRAFFTFALAFVRSCPVDAEAGRAVLSALVLDTSLFEDLVHSLRSARVYFTQRGGLFTAANEQLESAALCEALACLCALLELPPGSMSDDAWAVLHACDRRHYARGQELLDALTGLVALHRVPHSFQGKRCLHMALACLSALARQAVAVSSSSSLVAQHRAAAFHHEMTPDEDSDDRHAGLHWLLSCLHDREAALSSRAFFLFGDLLVLGVEDDDLGPALRRCVSHALAFDSHASSRAAALSALASYIMVATEEQVHDALGLRPLVEFLSNLSSDSLLFREALRSPSVSLHLGRFVKALAAMPATLPLVSEQLCTSAVLTTVARLLDVMHSFDDADSWDGSGSMHARLSVAAWVGVVHYLFASDQLFLTLPVSSFVRVGGAPNPLRSALVGVLCATGRAVESGAALTRSHVVMARAVLLFVNAMLAQRPKAVREALLAEPALRGVGDGSLPEVLLAALSALLEPPHDESPMLKDVQAITCEFMARMNMAREDEAEVVQDGASLAVEKDVCSKLARLAMSAFEARSGVLEGLQTHACIALAGYLQYNTAAKLAACASSPPVPPWLVRTLEEVMNDMDGAYTEPAVRELAALLTLLRSLAFAAPARVKNALLAAGVERVTRRCWPMCHDGPARRVCLVPLLGVLVNLASRHVVSKRALVLADSPRRNNDAKAATFALRRQGRTIGCLAVRALAEGGGEDEVVELYGKLLQCVVLGDEEVTQYLLNQDLLKSALNVLGRKRGKKVVWLRILVNLTLTECGREAVFRALSPRGGALLRRVVLRPIEAARAPPLVKELCHFVLRNLSFLDRAKSFLAGDERVLEVLVRGVEGESQRVRMYASSALWSLVYDCQRAKAAVKKAVEARLRDAALALAAAASALGASDDVIKAEGNMEAVMQLLQ